jgi:hypothetical protein
MLALAGDPEASAFQGPHRTQVRDAGDSHLLPHDGDFPSFSLGS